MLYINLYGKGTDPHGPTPRIGWEKRKWGDAGGGTMGAKDPRAYPFWEVIYRHWVSLYSNPCNWGSDIALGTSIIVLEIPKSGTHVLPFKYLLIYCSI